MSLSNRNSLKPYPEYLDTGLPWLGQIPAHWNTRRGKYIFQFKKELNIGKVRENVLSLTLRGVVNNDPDNPEGLVPKDYSSYQFFNRGDLVFKLIDLENLRTSRVGLVHEDGIMSPAYIRLTPMENINIKYFYYQYFDLYLRGVYNQIGAGVRATLPASDLLDLRLVVPSPSEQQAIVDALDFLEHLTRRYIRAKRRQIGVLNEQKQAIVQQAVTRGLDPNVRFKPSGVEGLGDIPEHWEVMCNRYIFREITRKGSTPINRGG